MYNIVIAEDNRAIREGLKLFFDDKIPEYSVLRCFTDGKETIEYIKENHECIDVVLTDIKMANQSGLDIARFIKQNNLDIVVVVLSAYQDFEFAREAISANVYGYLLKPVRFEKLKETFDEIKMKLDEKNVLPEDINESKIEKFVLKLSEAALSGGEELNSLIQELNLPEKVTNLQYCLLEIVPQTRFYESKERIINTVNKCLESMLLKGRSIFDLEESIVMLVVSNSQKASPDISDESELSKDNHELTVRKALGFIEENFANDICLADVAKYVYLSPMYFGRIFKEKTGVSFTDYLIEKRMNLACALLKEGKSVQETSFSVGYTNTQYFIRLFRKNIGMTPGMYKRFGDKNETTV